MATISHRTGISNILAASLMLGATSGYVFALFSLLMERSGVPTALIGYANSSHIAGILAMTLLLPRILPRANLFHLSLIACLTGSITIAVLTSLDLLPWAQVAWRFLLGSAGAALYIIFEYWLNLRVDDAHRGKTLGLYGTLVVLGMGSGPLLVPYAIENSAMHAAMILGMALHLLVALPVALTRSTAPHGTKENADQEAPSFSLFSLSPIAAVAALMFGIAESSMFAFMPIAGIRNGLSETEAVFLFTCIFWGGMIIHLPIGWLADRIAARSVLLIITAIGCAGGFLFPPLLHAPPSWLLWTHLFFWGGTITTIYTTALVLVGREHQGTSLAAAGLAFVCMYGIGGMIGPTASGFAMEWLGPKGLPWLMALACGLCFVFTALRSFKTFNRH